MTAAVDSTQTLVPPPSTSQDPQTWNADLFSTIFAEVVKVLLTKGMNEYVREMPVREMMKRVLPPSLQKTGKDESPHVKCFRDWFKSGFVGVYPHKNNSALEYIIVRDSGDFRLVTAKKSDEIADASTVERFLSKLRRPVRDQGTKRKSGGTSASGGASGASGASGGGTAAAKKKKPERAPVPETL
jgi:hypothetical protein